MFETLKYNISTFLVRGMSHRWQQQCYIMSKMEEIEAVVTKVILRLPWLYQSSLVDLKISSLSRAEVVILL